MTRITGIGTDYLDSEKRIKGPTLKKNVMKRRMELEALGEELRVLYVALTRAKEKLILTASSRKLEDRIAKWSAVAAEHGAIPYTILTLASSYLDWILMSIRKKKSVISYQRKRFPIRRPWIGTQIRQTLSRSGCGGGGEDAICRMTRIIQTRKIGSKISGK